MKQRSSTVEILGDLFVPTPRNIFGFLLASVALGVAGNSVFGLLTSWHDSVWFLLLLLPASLILLLLAAKSLQVRERIREHGAPPIEVKFGGNVAPHRALIVFVSGGTAHEDAVAFHIGSGSKPILEHCWLIHSDYPAGRAREFKTRMDEQYHERVRFYVGEHDEYRLDDVNDIGSAYRMYLSVIDHVQALGIPARETIVDVTGGTALVTAGAVWACAKRGIAAEYIKQRVTPTTFVTVDVEWAEGLTFKSAQPAEAS